MNKRYLWRMSLWIGILVGLYCLVYQFLPLPVKNLMWVTFIALPIYFGAGARPEEFLHFFSSMLAGVPWAYIYLWGISWLVKMGLSVPVAMLLAVAVVSVALCAFHLIVTPNTWFNKLPMVFGTVAALFSTSGKHLVTVLITLALGLIVGMLCTIGTQLLTRDLVDEARVQERAQMEK